DNASTNVSDFRLEDVMGAKHPEYYKLIPVTVIYCVIFITGLIGNISTCVVIARNRYMQTATNYYLFNLAIADLLVLVLGLPQETYSVWSAYPWVFGETFCIVRSMAAETSTYASILTITAFTMERYLAICHPMRAQTLSSLKRAIKVVMLLWFVSAICAIPIVVQYGIVYVLHPISGERIEESAICNVRPERYLKHTFEVATFLFFLTPMTVISVLYIMIGLAIRRSAL
uniref:G-protein coupled receptors family 1 profile domain-containing protein n=1 Tax=Capitella teleta TaxID=283909 RepID=X2B220_CAPTE